MTRCHSQFFWHFCVSLVRISYWSKCNVNIISGSGVMMNFVHKGCRKSEIGETPVWVLYNIWRQEWIRDTKFAINVSNENLLNAAKCYVYSFYHFWVIKGRPSGEQKHTSHQIRVKEVFLRLLNIIGRMVKFNEKTLLHCKIIFFLQILLDLWNIISELAQFKHILLFRKNEGSNIS